MFSSENHDVVSASWSHDDKKLQAYSMADWANASAWDASILPFFADFDDQRVQKANAILLSGLELNPVYVRSDKHLRLIADYQEIFRQAGFPRQLFDIGYPSKDEVQWADMDAIVREVLSADYHVPHDAIDTFDIQAVYHVATVDAPEWKIQVLPYDDALSDIYYITIDGISEQAKCSEHDVFIH